MIGSGDGTAGEVWAAEMLEPVPKRLAELDGVVGSCKAELKHANRSRRAENNKEERGIVDVIFLIALDLEIAPRA